MQALQQILMALAGQSTIFRRGSRAASFDVGMSEAVTCLAALRITQTMYCQYSKDNTRPFWQHTTLESLDD